VNGVICIDFGSAYTKVAFRKTTRSTGRLLLDLESAQQDRTLGMGFCVPTVVAVRSRGDRFNFVYGDAAASILPTDKVDVCRNWKPKLLATPGKRSPLGPTWREIGRHFFQLLRDDVLSTLATQGVDASKWPARVCIPRVASTNENNAISAIREALCTAGWPMEDEGAGSGVLYEPAANTWGVLTKGINRPGLKTPGLGEGSYNLRSMIKQGRLFRALRHAYSMGSGDSFRFPVLVIDIGAYTTDCGLVTIDGKLVERDRGSPDVVHRSFENGVKELDAAIFSSASKEEQAAIVHQNTQQWESLKPRLYAGLDVALTWSHNGKPMRTKVAGRPVETLVDEFSETVISCVEEFVAKHIEGDYAQEVILTGGGMRIARVSSQLVRAVKEGRIRARDVHDPAAEDELVRGATAIGGVSLLFG